MPHRAVKMLVESIGYKSFSVNGHINLQKATRIILSFFSYIN